MTEVRISKYLPTNRNNAGAYLLDDWTSASDIGERYSLTAEDYLAQEDAYWEAAREIFSRLQIRSLTISEVEIELPLRRLGIPQLEKLSDHPVLRKLSEGSNVDILEFEVLFRLGLREMLWVRAKADKNTYVHFGYDLYVYIGSEQDFTVPDVEGVFIEPFASPYHNDYLT
jgi:hypothetical protein